MKDIIKQYVTPLIMNPEKKKMLERQRRTSPTEKERKMILLE